MKRNKHPVASLMRRSLLVSAVFAAVSAHAAVSGCGTSCTDYLRPNVEAVPLTQARIDASAGSLAKDFTTYLAASKKAMDADKATLRSERQGLSSVPKSRASDKSSPDTMPLSESSSYYAGSKALGIAKEIISFQTPAGGWAKNMPRTGALRLKGQSFSTYTVNPATTAYEDWLWVGTLDNSATWTELRYLAKVQGAQSSDRAAIQASIVKGVNYLLNAQYPSGGWPQVYPLAGKYHDAVTINDDAMLSAIKLLREIGLNSNKDFSFLDASLRSKAAAAADKGVNWLLTNQVSINGKLTVWGQQHDALTQKPTPARTWEMAALTAQESAKIMSFLMALPSPDARTRAAVYGAADFFKATQINNKKWSSGKFIDASGTNSWARFYDLAFYTPTDATVSKRARALFGDKPELHGSNEYGLVFTSLAAFPAESLGYAWYGSTAQSVLTRFSDWSAKNARP
ncbi:pectate lyase [Viridibacterium curvum]